MTKEVIYDGFEKKSLSDIWSQKKIEPSAIEIQSKIVRKGKNALKITIHKGDCFQPAGVNSKDSERDELRERKNLWPHEGESHGYSFSIYIPKDFPIVPTRLVLAQWKQNDEFDKASVNNPILALRYVGGELFITLQTTEKKNILFSTHKEIRGKWLDFVFHIKFIRTKSGFVRIWMNKKKIINYKGVTAYTERYNYPKPGRFYFKMGLYRDQMDRPMTAYFDEYHRRRMK